MNTHDVPTVTSDARELLGPASAVLTPRIEQNQDHGGYVHDDSSQNRSGFPARSWSRASGLGCLHERLGQRSDRALFGVGVRGKAKRNRLHFAERSEHLRAGQAWHAGGSRSSGLLGDGSNQRIHLFNDRRFELMLDEG
jgi:hypothetical protein